MTKHAITGGGANDPLEADCSSGSLVLKGKKEWPKPEPIKCETSKSNTSTKQPTNTTTKQPTNTTTKQPTTTSKPTSTTTTSKPTSTTTTSKPTSTTTTTKKPEQYRHCQDAVDWETVTHGAAKYVNAGVKLLGNWRFSIVFTASVFIRFDIFNEDGTWHSTTGLNVVDNNGNPVKSISDVTTECGSPAEYDETKGWVRHAKSGYGCLQLHELQNGQNYKVVVYVRDEVYRDKAIGGWKVFCGVCNNCSLALIDMSNPETISEIFGNEQGLVLNPEIGSNEIESLKSQTEEETLGSLLIVQTYNDGHFNHLGYADEENTVVFAAVINVPCINSKSYNTMLGKLKDVVLNNANSDLVSNKIYWLDTPTFDFEFGIPINPKAFSDYNFKEVYNAIVEESWYTFHEALPTGYVVYVRHSPELNIKEIRAFPYITDAQRDRIIKHNKDIWPVIWESTKWRWSHITQHLMSVSALKAMYAKRTPYYNSAILATKEAEKFCGFCAINPSIDSSLAPHPEQWRYPNSVCNQVPTDRVYETKYLNWWLLHVQPDVMKAKGNTKYLVKTVVEAPNTGVYNFLIKSDDGFELYINCIKVRQGPIGEHDFNLNLTKGKTEIILRYENVPDQTPGYIALKIKQNGVQIYEARASNFKGQANSIGEIEMT